MATRSAARVAAHADTDADADAEAAAAPRVRAIVATEPVPTFGEKTAVAFDVAEVVERVPIYSLSLPSVTPTAASNHRPTLLPLTSRPALPATHEQTNPPCYSLADQPTLLQYLHG